MVHAVEEDRLIGHGNSRIDQVADGCLCLLCHLANIAQRTGETLTLDGPRLAQASEAATAMWSREYEPGWEPVV